MGCRWLCLDTFCPSLQMQSLSLSPLLWGLGAQLLKLQKWDSFLPGAGLTQSLAHSWSLSKEKRPWVRCPSPQHPLREAVSLMRATPWHLHDHTALWGFTFVPPGLMREKPLPSGTGSGFLHHLLLPVLITAHIFIVSPFTKFSPNSPFFSCHLL